MFGLFSSSRRHTRLVSDWSSDVCSSDLVGAYAGAVRLRGMITAVDAHAGGEPGRVIVGGVLDVPGRSMFEKRSEERRVGKGSDEQESGQEECKIWSTSEHRTHLRLNTSL